MPEGFVESASAEAMLAPADVTRIFRAAGVAAQLEIPSLDELASIDAPHMIRTYTGDWFAFGPSVEGRLVPLGSGQRVPPEVFAGTWSGWTVVVRPALDPADAFRPPALAAHPESVSLGPRFPGEVACATVAVSNTGGSPLRLRPVRDPAGAAPPAEVTGADGNSIPAGATASLEVCLRIPHLFREQAVVLMTNDPDRPTLRLPLSAAVLPTVRLEPDTVFFGGVARGVIADATVRVEAMHPPDFAVESVKTSSDALSASVREVAPGPPRLLDVRISLDAREASSGDFSGDVFLRTNNPADPMVIIPVHAGISPRDPDQ